MGLSDIIIDDGIDMFTTGAGALLLVDAMRDKLQAQDRRRKIAVGRCKRGQPFVIETEDAHDANDTQAPA